MNTRILVLISAFVGLLSTSLRAQVVNIESRRLNEDSTGIFGSIGLDFTLNKNTALVLRGSNENQVLWKRKKNLFLLFTDLSLVQADNRNFLNQGFSHLRFNQQLTEKRRVLFESFYQAQYNQIQRIQFRQLAGAGFRIRGFNRDSIQLFFGSLIMGEYEEISDREAINRDVRLSSYLAVNWQPTPSLAISSTTYFQPTIYWLYDYRISSDTRVRVNFSEHFSLAIKYNLLHDNFPPQGVPKTIYSLENGFEFRF